MAKELTLQDVRGLALPKWPRLIVVGQNVTRAQAEQILIRTDGFYLSSNDRAFKKTILSSCGIAQSDKNYDEYERTMADFFDSIDHISLSYLNNSRILSCWIGGAHGWCDWDGKIGSSNYNIGKWPSVEEVYSDWVAIAKAFPFLNLTAQLLSTEGEADDPEYTPTPVVEFVISDGCVKIVEPSAAPLVPPTEPSLLGLLGGTRAERGVTAQRFTTALENVKSAVLAKRIQEALNGTPAR